MVLKKICLSVYVFLLAGIAAFAQEGFELVGKVIDRETHEPLPYCAILNKLSGTFTITNVNGEFRLNRVKAVDTIQISTIGFEPASIAAGDIKQRGEIALAPRSIEVEEVVVRGVNPKKYMSKVYGKIVETFPSQYPTFDGIYRRQLLEDGRYVFLGECEVACRNRKKHRNSPKVSVVQATATINKTYNENVFFVTLYTNLILYPQFYFFTDDTKWKFLGSKVSEDGLSEVYVLAYTALQKGEVVEEGTVCVSSQDDAVLRVERHLAARGNLINKHNKFQVADDGITILYKYKKIDSSKYALYYSRCEWSFKLIETGKGVHEYTMVNDFLVTSYDSRRKRINKDASVNPFKIAKEMKTVAVSELKHLIPDYALDQTE